MQPFAWTAALAFVLIVTTGALGDPFHPDEVPFESVRRDHFDALAVSRGQGEPSEAPITLLVQPLGDASGADLRVAKEWLLRNANVRVVESEDGAPLFLTHGDLAATSGRATLGATVPGGMAVEMGDPAVGACVATHEMLHFLGLKHVKDPDNIMYPHCSKDLLQRAVLEPAQREQLSRLAHVRATTVGGVETWASR